MPLGAYQILTKGTAQILTVTNRISDMFSMAEEGVVLVNFQNEEVYEEVFFHRHNRDKNCWTIPKEKAASFVAKAITTAKKFQKNQP